MEAWQARSGEIDPRMEQALNQMQEEALEREQQRIDEALGGADGQ